MTKLSVSNIAWSGQKDTEMYQYLKNMEFQGIEIAPTRIFENNPYDRIKEAGVFAENLYRSYNLEISSMQSIWYGRSQELFGSVEERNELLDYTKKAILFANKIGCHNLVFGCPKNRNIKKEDDYHIAVEFFGELGDFAKKNDTVLAMEANPVIYHTNFITETRQAFELVRQVDSEAFLVNLDLGTVIENKEDLNIVRENMHFVNHIHISEPQLAAIKKRGIHKELKQIIDESGYSKYVSVEMKSGLEVKQILEILDYVKEVFN